MTIGEALASTAKRLSPHSSTPRLDAEVLLAHVLSAGRAWLLAHSDEPLHGQGVRDFDDLISRRLEGEPVAYLTGHKEFYGLDLAVTRDVLVPRPETEAVVEACLEILPEHELSQMADVGTGSGAILVAVAARRPNMRGIGTDISPAALKVARENCKRYGLEDRVQLCLGHLLEPLPGKVNIITANLPYVPPGEAEPDVARWEPHVAVYGGGGTDGTALIREFLETAPAYLLPHGTVVMETAHSQGGVVYEMARSAFPEAGIEVRKDLSGYDRIVVIWTP